MNHARGGIETDGHLIPPRLESRRVLASRGSIHRDNPDDTPKSEAVDLIRRFKRESEDSELRTKAMRWWQECDRFLEGDQWDEDIVKHLAPWQAQLTINKLHKVREKWASLLMKSIPKVEFLPRDAANTLIADAIDGFFAHEWERNGWATTIGIVLKQAIAHGIGWVKIYWDVHGDGGRGVVKIEPVSNYDLFLDDGAVIRDGKLECKYAIHRFEMTRNKILSVYEDDPGGALKSDAEAMEEYADGSVRNEPPKSRILRYLDDLNVGESTRGSGGVGGDDMTERHPEHAVRKEVYTVNECLYFDDSRIEGPEVDAAEGEIPPLKYPNGRIMTECNGTLLYDDANRLGFNMYVPLCLSPDIERIYNPSLIYHCISPQKELNKRRSQIADHASMAANPVLVISQASQIDQDFIPYPGAVIVTMDEQSPNGGVWWLEPPPLAPEVVQSSSASDRDIDVISAIEDVAWGRETNQLESGVALDHLQGASETIPNMYTMFIDDGFKTICRNVASCYLDFVSEERKYRFLDTRKLEMAHGSFNPSELLLPSREDAIAVIQEEIGVFLQQIDDAETTLPPEEVEEIVPYIAAEIQAREAQIDQIWQMPASDLVSFDVMLQTGTRDLTKVAVQSMAAQILELGGITLPTYMEMVSFPNWLQAYNLKQQELQAEAEAEAEAIEEQVALQREIDEDEHEQDLEVERVKGKFRIQEALIRAKTQIKVAQKRENSTSAKEKK